MKKIYLFFTVCSLLTYSDVFGQSGPNSLTLEKAVELALENSLNVQRSQIDLYTNEASLTEISGQRLPSFSTGASSGYRWGRSINPVTNLFENNRIGNVNLFGNANVTLFAGQQVSNSFRQAKTNIEISKTNIATAENNVILSVVNLFINVLFAEEQLKIAQSQLNSTKEQLSITTRLVEAGSQPLANRLDIQAQNATNELEVINATNNLRIAKLNLSQALLIPFNESLQVVAPELEAESQTLTESDVDEIFAIALEAMPQIKAAALGIESAEYGVRISKGAFYPTLGFGASAFSNYVDQYFLGETAGFGTQIQNNFSNSANFQLNIPIFSNFRNKAGLQRARLQKKLSEINEQEVKLQLRQDIESSYTDAVAARQSYRASIIRVESLEEAFRIAKQRFESGAINSVDFQVAQNNLFNAQADLVSAKYRYIFRVKILDFYLGNPITL
jgi:outer membrane protein